MQHPHTLSSAWILKVVSNESLAQGMCQTPTRFRQRDDLVKWRQRGNCLLSWLLRLAASMSFNFIVVATLTGGRDFYMTMTTTSSRKHSTVRIRNSCLNAQKSHLGTRR